MKYKLTQDFQILFPFHSYTNKAKLDNRVRRVWIGGQAFFALMGPDHTSYTCRYLNKSLQQCHVLTSQKRNENTRDLQLKHATYLLSIGRECHTFYWRSSDLLSEKRDLPKLITMNGKHVPLCCPVAQLFSNMQKGCSVWKWCWLFRIY